MKCLVLAGVLAVAGLAAHAADLDEAAPSRAELGLARLSSMAGNWYTVGPDGKPSDELVSVIRVTAAGTAVQETHFPGEPHEMVTLYYVEAGELTLVHYCALGNQPKMRATELTEDVLEFVCTGLADERESHMHSAHIEIVAEGRTRVEWSNWEAGERVQLVGFDLIRK